MYEYVLLPLRFSTASAEMLTIVWLYDYATIVLAWTRKKWSQARSKHSVMYHPVYGWYKVTCHTCHTPNPISFALLFWPCIKPLCYAVWTSVYAKAKSFNNFHTISYIHPLNIISISCLFSLAFLAQCSAYYSLEYHSPGWLSLEIVMFSAFTLFVSLLYVWLPPSTFFLIASYHADRICQSLSIPSPRREFVCFQQASTDTHTRDPTLDVTRCHCHYSFNRRGRRGTVWDYS